MIFRDATLFQVTQSVTRNGKSIMLTMMLALVLIYLFSVLGFMFFRDDFLTNIRTRAYSSYPHHRYRRSTNNPKTTTLTRRSTSRCSCLILYLLLLFFSFDVTTYKEYCF